MIYCYILKNFIGRSFLLNNYKNTVKQIHKPLKKLLSSSGIMCNTLLHTVDFMADITLGLVPSATL